MAELPTLKPPEPCAALKDRPRTVTETAPELGKLARAQEDTTLLLILHAKLKLPMSAAAETMNNRFGETEETDLEVTDVSDNQPEAVAAVDPTLDRLLLSPCIMPQRMVTELDPVLGEFTERPEETNTVL